MLEPYFLNEYRSKLTTTNGVFYSILSPYELLDVTCIKYASTIEGRMKAVREMFDYDKKTPFVIIPYDVGAFPTMSDKSSDCVWIFNHRFSIKEVHKGVCQITFLNGFSAIVNCSKHILRNQQKRLHTSLDVYRQIHRTGSDF